MNISSPVDGTHWGMPRKQPYHELTHTLCSSGVGIWREALFSNVVFLLFGLICHVKQLNAHLQSPTVVHT